MATGVILFVVAMAALWLEPGAYRPLRHIPVLMAAVAGAVSGLVFFGKRIQPRTALSLLVAGFWWIWCVLAGVSTIDSSRSLISLEGWTAALFVFILASVGFASGRAWRAFMGCLVCGAVFYCLMAVGARGANLPLTGSFVNRDTFSVLPMLCVFLSLALVRGPNKVLRGISYAASLLFSVVVVASGSRAAVVGVVCGAVAFVGALGLGRNKELFHRAWRLAVAGSVFVLLVGLLSGTLQSLIGRFGEAVNGQDIQGITMRNDVLVHGIELSLRRPFLGFGPGTFAMAYQEVRPRGVVPDYIMVNFAHNDYIELLTETGWVGLLAWGAVVALVLIRGVRLIRFAMASWEAACLMGAICSAAAFSGLNFIVPVPAVFIWFMITLGALQGMPTTASSGECGPSVPQKVVGVVLTVFSLILAQQAFGALRSAQYLEHAKDMGLALRWEDSLRSLDDSLAWRPGSIESLIARGETLARMGQFQKRDEWLKRAEADLLKARSISPRDEPAMSALFRYYAAVKDYPKAEEVLIAIHKHASYREWVLPVLARIQALQKNLLGAVETIHLSSINDAKVSDVLPGLLADLEAQHPGQAVARLEEWCQQEGDTGLSFGTAKAVVKVCISRKAYSASERLVRFCVTQRPDEPEVLYLASQVFALKGDLVQQRSFLQKLSAKGDGALSDEYVDSAMIDLARIKGLKSPGVLKSLEMRLKKFPKSVPLCLAVSDAYMAERRWDDAAQVLSVALDVVEDNATLQTRMGQCLVAQGLGDLAAQYFEAALKLDPGQVEARKALLRLKSQAPRG